MNFFEQQTTSPLIKENTNWQEASNNWCPGETKAIFGVFLIALRLD